MEKKDVLATIKDYQKIIRNLDKRLALYEQLGSPGELAKKLGIELKKIEESKIEEPDLRKEVNLNPSISKKLILENKELVKAEVFNKSRAMRIMEGM